MTKLEQFVQDRLDRIKRSSDISFQEILFSQAFGAIELACVLCPEHEAEIIEWWNNSKCGEFWDALGG